jgi:hypothetical protein
MHDNFVWLQIPAHVFQDIVVMIVLKQLVCRHATMVGYALRLILVLVHADGLIQTVQLLYASKLVEMEVIVRHLIHVCVQLTGLDMIVGSLSVSRSVVMVASVWLPTHALVHQTGVDLIVVNQFVIKASLNLTMQKK